MRDELIIEPENIRTVKEYFSALRTGDMKALQSLFADDIIWHQPGQGRFSGTHRGKEAVFSLLGRFMEVSEGSFEIDQVKAIMANRDLVSATIHFTAAKQGRNMAMDGVDLMRVENGHIKEVWLFSDDIAAEDRFWGT